MYTAAYNYPWAEELEKTVISSLATSFGLDFLFFHDKIGGDVNTVNNVRQGIWATEQEENRFNQREIYDKKISSAYHSNVNYINTGKEDKNSHAQGTLFDPYRNTVMSNNEKRNTDHVISSKEIHDDAGRILANLDGVVLANQSSNLQSTHETINKSKKQTSIENYLDKLPSLIISNQVRLEKSRQKLNKMSQDTPEQRHKAQELMADIKKTEERIHQLNSIDPDAMKKRDKIARDHYDYQINKNYYTSSNFLGETAKASSLAGLQMGSRQMLGLILAEVWFELRSQIPLIYKKLQSNFELDSFINGIKETLSGIMERVKIRFSDFLVSFKDGVFSGIFSSLTTTIINIFTTTQKLAAKIIRELWSSLVKVIKILIFNPDELSFVELCKSVIQVLSVGAATVVGSLVYGELSMLFNFPFGGEFAAFAGALTTGVITLGLNYFLLHSSTAKKLWDFIASIMPHAGEVSRFQAINAELDTYIMEWGKIEFGLDIYDLEEFSNSLSSVTNEVQRSIILKQEIKKRNITLPYEQGNTQSTRKWLKSLVK